MSASREEAQKKPLTDAILPYITPHNMCLSYHFSQTVSSSSSSSSSSSLSLTHCSTHPNMGNCVFGGFRPVDGEVSVIKVITSNGGIMELFAPITAECVTNEFPGHGIFPDLTTSSHALMHNEELHVGHIYYLLPLSSRVSREGHIRSSSSSSFVTPYRMSFDNQGLFKRSLENNSDQTIGKNGAGQNGMWKVKLVISPEQLSEILSQEASTEALIESVRTVAKCGNGVTSSVANSDQWSLSSSWKTWSEYLV